MNFPLCPVRPPLLCQFVQQNIDWLGETRRLVADGDPGIHWRTSEIGAVDGGRDRLVVLEYNGSDAAVFVERCHRQVDRGSPVAVVAQAPIDRLATALAKTGVCCVLTNVSQCDRLVRVIRRVRDRQVPRVMDSRAAILSRLPWSEEPAANE